LNSILAIDRGCRAPPDESGPPKVWARFQRLTPHLLLAITTLGGVLRAYQIGDQGLWLDEAFSVWLAQRPVGEMIDWIVRIDQHPPLYYLLLHLWMSLGRDEIAVRMLSALCGTLTIPVMYLLGHRLADDGVGLLAALILAVSPFHVRFAQEARMYTLLTLNASLALYALTRLLTDARSAELSLGQQLVDLRLARRVARTAQGEAVPEGEDHPDDPQEPYRHPDACISRRWLPLRAIKTDLAWLGYILFTAATLFSHNTAILFPVATNVLVLGLLVAQRRPHPSASPMVPLAPPSPRNWALAQAGVFLLWSPWLAGFVAQSAGVYQEFWIPPPTLETVAGTLATFLSAFLPPQIGWLRAAWVLYAGLALLGLIRLWRQPGRLALLLTVFLTPFAGELLISLRRPIFYTRTLIWASLPLYLVLAAGIGRLRSRACALAATLMLVVVNGVSLRAYYADFQKEQWDDAAALVAQRAAPADLILFNATWVQIPFDYYFHTYNRDVAEHGAPVDLFDRGVLEPRMTTSDLPRLRTLIRDHGRVWLVYSHDWYTDPQGLIPSALEEKLGVREQWDFHGLQIRLYAAQ